MASVERLQFDHLVEGSDACAPIDYSAHTSPGCNTRKRSGAMPAARRAAASALTGASIGSSVSCTVP